MQGAGGTVRKFFNAKKAISEPKVEAYSGELKQH